MGSDEVDNTTAIRVGGDRARGSICLEARGTAGRQPERSGRAGMSRMATAVLDVLGVALAARLGRPEAVARETSQRSLQVSAHAFIEQELPYPEPSPATAAGADHLSMPYLYRLFESQGSLLTGSASASDESDVDITCWTSRATPVSSIGARWGLANAGHFSRTFRNVYGVSAIQYQWITREVTTMPAARIPAECLTAAAAPPVCNPTAPALEHVVDPPRGCLIWREKRANERAKSSSNCWWPPDSRRVTASVERDRGNAVTR